MRHTFRTLLSPKNFKVLLFGAFCFYGALHAQIAPYPNRPLTMVLPYATGGTVDIQARLLASGLTQKLGQPVIVRNMPGATGAIATDFVVHAVPDGYTLLFASSAQTTSVPLTEKVNYKLEDLAPVSASGRGTMILAINSQVPAKNLTEFIAYGKANQGKISYGSSGTGSVGHLVGALFGARAGLEIVHIPYKGGGPVMSDLLGGQIQTALPGLAAMMSHIKDGKLRPLAVTGAARSPLLPEVPTLNETVMPGFEIANWFGVLAPTQTPPAIIRRLNAELVKMMQAAAAQAPAMGKPKGKEKAK